MKNKFIDIVMWFVWVPLRKVLVSIPHPLTVYMLKALSFMLYLVDVERRKGVEEELRLLMGDRFNDREMKKVVKSSFYIFITKVYENLLFGNATEKHFDRVAAFEGMENLDEALKKKKGVVLLSFHFGSFFLFMLGLGLKGYKINAMTGTPIIDGSSYIKNKMFELRKKEEHGYPFNILSVGTSLKPLVKALRDNEIVGIVIDGRESTKQVAVPLFNRIGQFSPGIFNLCLKTGAQILPVAPILGPGSMKHRLIIEPALELTVTEDKEETLRINVEKFIGIFQKYIWDYPDHYAMTLYGIRKEAESGLIPPLFKD
ncbi:MAG TPA: hypothetical protein ENH38_00105 [Nitrospirae bacterium]|nr:hypothetical protein [Nitrospirota bacterium]HDZ87003.1 hypothetical protein [Nitrospirota bacterium]